ncbi:MAG: DUF2288 domain-containing protein [Verrucomicrobiales bacterium]|nr:DUF2288 domain-containing protein [Verrucomicrobiales bacterium]
MSDAADEEMKYGILGEDTDSDLDKLEKYTGEVEWRYLEKHYAAGNLLYVDPVLDLIEVGKAFTEDNSDAVASWKKSGDLVQPSTPHAFYWEESKARFKALVVSPFVLIQPIKKETS